MLAMAAVAVSVLLLASGAGGRPKPPEVRVGFKMDRRGLAPQTHTETQAQAQAQAQPQLGLPGELAANAPIGGVVGSSSAPAALGAGIDATAPGTVHEKQLLDPLTEALRCVWFALEI